MPVLVLQIEKPYWQDVLIEMRNRGLDIGACIVHYRDVGGPNQFFENFNGKLIDGKTFYRLNKITEMLYRDFGNSVPALNKVTIENFTDIERDYYNLTDRFSYYPKSFRYRKRLFRQSLRYFLAFFATNKIDAVFAACTPHNLSDYIAFHVAKKLGIPTVLTAHTMVNDYILIRHDYRAYEKVPADFMPDANEADLKKIIPQTLYDSAIKESNIIKVVAMHNDRSIKSKNLNVKNTKKKVNLPVLTRNIKRYFNSPHYKNALAMNAIYSPWRRRMLKKYEHFRLKKLHKYLDSIVITPNLEEKFIYFAMHLQPERTSTPEAEIFEDQLMAVEILAKAMPEGWQLYIKENPRQFDKIGQIKSRHFRDVEDYKDILRLPNVHLISMKISSKDLIAKAQVTATLTGSIGWEALQMGKGCIVFGNAWFSACDSIFRVDNVEEAKHAITEIPKITPEQTRLNLLHYLAYKKDEFTIGNMGDPQDLRVAMWPYEKIVGDAAERIFEELKAVS